MRLISADFLVVPAPMTCEQTKWVRKNCTQLRRMATNKVKNEKKNEPFK